MKRRLDLGRTLTALSDPTRRAVIELLVEKPRRAGELADALSVSPPALSRQLRVLRASGLVASDLLESDARVRMYQLRPEPFLELRDWLVDVESYWSDQLHAFKAHAERKTRRRQR